jgi:hypothetical protein
VITFYKLEATFENMLVTSEPIVTIVLKAAMEMNKAIIAYSTAVAPRRSSLICRSAERMPETIPCSGACKHGSQTIDE